MGYELLGLGILIVLLIIYYITNGPNSGANSYTT